jgi:hypothetical protein
VNRTPKLTHPIALRRVEAFGLGHQDLSPYQYLPRTNGVNRTPKLTHPIALRRVVAFGLGHQDLSPFHINTAPASSPPPQ